MTIIFRTAFNYDANQVSDETGLDCSDDPTLTQQQFKDESSLDFILQRYAQTGILPFNEVQPIFADLVGMTNDYHQALDIVLAAENAFYDLPSYLRERFSNDPKQLLRFLDDDANRDEAISLGLIPKPSEPTISKVEIVNVNDKSPQDTQP